MPLRQWQSNLRFLQNSIDAEIRDDSRITTVLGLRWDIEKDILAINVPPLIQQTEELTMLPVLQISLQIYNPLSWFTPITIRSQMLLQKLHAQSYMWETQLNNSENSEWCEIYSDL